MKRLSAYAVGTIAIALLLIAAVFVMVRGTGPDLTGAGRHQPKHPLSGKQLYRFPGNYIQKELASEQDGGAKALIAKIAAQPIAQWYGQWVPDIRAAVSRDIAGAGDKQLPVLVAYNIPYRDCGQYSAGGSDTADAYRQWVDGFGAGLGNKEAIIIVEPDAAIQTQCLDEEQERNRYELLGYAVSKFQENPKAHVYLDAGNARWGSAEQVAERLQKAGIARADGFSVNVSNYYSDAESLGYAKKLSALAGGKRFVIDSSRNGNGPLATGAWCNPPGRALGSAPKIVASADGLDAFLWVKQPGMSDGTCNGGPAAGQWWRENALELAKGAK